MRAIHNNNSTRQAGFTLIEIMVGLVIGLLATIIIMQVFSVFETQKRTTTGSADAQTNGGIALFDITREMQLAGYPLTPVSDSALECTAVTIDGTAGFNHSVLSPVSITDNTSDSITIRYGTSPSGGAPGTITGPGPDASSVTMTNTLGCMPNDRTLIVNGTNCSMASASAVTGAVTLTLTDPNGAAINANVFCLGTWNTVTFAVNNGNLERNGTPILPGIVNLQAQYGISATPNTNQIAQWVNATGASWTTPSLTDRNRIKAIRIAVVARNAKIETSNVTSSCSSLTNTAPTGLCAWAGTGTSPAPSIDLSADANWQRYRYRVFETIIPLKNVIWAKDTL